ncbi:integral membrane protein DUF106-domain-containing protein [Tribonema minus]|uniref:ER membrane protein complex subunit 3 n=1 Tax=Tribonema minus TaxID=303371 RepID=A0A835YX73_9STRA|nr:integral membrane protein DUF106-domain-containing protein [Tribonema minus]
MVHQHLTLDPAIRNWCLFPLMVVMILASVLRHYVPMLFQSDKPADADDQKLRQTLGRAQRLRMNGRFLHGDAYRARRTYFISEEKEPSKDTEKGLGDGMKGALKNPPAADPTAAISDPSKMMGPLINNAGFVVTNMFMGAFSSYFMAGFVMVKVPFPLTSRFKVMLQRGVEISTLDPSYVSSVSWYMLVMFGMRNLIMLALGESGSAQDEQRAMQAQMGMGAPQPMFDAKKAFGEESTILGISLHAWAGDSVEQRLLGGRYPVPSLLDMPMDGSTKGGKKKGKRVE